MVIFSPCTSYSELLNSNLAGFINAFPAPASFPTFPLSQTSVQSCDCSFFALMTLLPARDTLLDFLFSLPFCSIHPSGVLLPSFPLFLSRPFSVTCSYWSLADWWPLIGSGHFSFKCLGAFCSSSYCKLLPHFHSCP